jgi:Na+-driven multidrug efflux pump
MQIKKAYNELLLVSIISTVSVLLHVTVDSIIIGRFLGAEAVAASGLVGPFSVIFLVAGMVLGFGAGLLCIKYVGMADMERANSVFSTTVITSVVISLMLSIFMFLCARFLAVVIVPENDEVRLVNSITGYLKGYAFILPASWLCFIFSNIIMADNGGKRVAVAMLVVLVADSILDLMNVFLFEGGLFGMALASTISQYLSLAVMLLHFRRSDSLYEFTPGKIDFGELKNVIEYGTSHVFRQGAVIIRKMGINAIFLAAGSVAAVTSFTISQSIFIIIAAVGMGIVSASASVTSMFYGEKNQKQLKEISIYSIRMTIKTLTAAAVFIAVAAPFLVRLFLKEGAEIPKAEMLVRCQAIQIVLTALSYAAVGIYQGTKRLKTAYLLTLMQDGVLPLLGVWMMTRIWGVAGAEWGFILAGILSLILVFIVSTALRHRFPTSFDEIIPLPDDCIIPEERLYEEDISTIESVLEASRSVVEKCRISGADKRTTLLAGLFVEEMGKNIIEHGFADGKRHSAEVRLVCEDTGWMLRIRDNCKPFDPVEWFKLNKPEDITSHIGIRMIVKMAEDIKYLSVLHMNSLILNISLKGEEQT